jgi:hypothetical protein
MSVPMPVRRSPCFTVGVRYEGNPLEDVTTFVRQADGTQVSAVSDTRGAASFCLSEQARRKPMLVWARAGKLAASTLRYCSGSRCEPIACRQPQLRVRTVSARALRIAVRCGRRALVGQKLEVRSGPGGRRVARVRTRVGWTTVSVPHGVRKVRARYRGDQAFLFRARTSIVRLG